MKHPASGSFRNLGIITIIAVYLLILVGGIVRSTGAGMGCPDWPKCFGRWIPPTDESQLPANYRQIYHPVHATPNMRDNMSYLKFNVYKTWTEYINRLIGAVIGLLILLTFIFSFKFIKIDNTITVLCGFTFILVVFQAWIGSVVVSTNLAPWIITIHMGIALVITALLIYIVTRSQKNLFSARHLTRIPYLKLLLFIALMLTFIQILLGTQVRQDVDTVAASFDYANRHLWIDNLGRWFYIHRSFSIAVFLFNVLLIYVLKKNVKAESTLNESYPTGKFLIWSSGYLLLGFFLQIITGIVMAYFNIPLYLQPVHLLLGVLIFGIQFFMLLMLNYSESLTKIPKFRAE